MNKRITLSIIGIIIISAILIVIVKNNTKEFIEYDGTLLALTIDGSPSTSFPTDASKYHIDIECEGGIGEYLPVKVLDSSGKETDNYEMKFTIKNITKDGVKCFIDFTTITDSNKNNYLLKTKVESVNTTNNNGYRYSGKTPSNYIWFNNELWRIIGSVPTKLSDNTTDNMVKVIRNESIGGISYDAKSSGYTGAWGSNTLYSLLNEAYYGKVNANDTTLTVANYCVGYYYSSYKPIPDCDYSKIGISSNSNDYYGKMIENVYWNTGASLANGSGTTISVLYTEIATQTVSGKIGLMSVSDFGYAGLYYDEEMKDQTFANYTSSNWLYGQGDEWTIIQYSSKTNYVIKISFLGYVSYSTANGAKSIRPVVYLNPNVYIISGNGTESSPYILGM